MKTKFDTLGPFLWFDGKVLRFWGYWDDRGSQFGVIHSLEIHYFLRDATLEIKDIIPENSGRDSGSLFLKKMRLPKFVNGMAKIGETTPISLLNVLGGSSGIRYIADPLNCGATDIEFYQEQDLCLGAEINVFGRKVILTDCDSFTKEFYRIKYGLNNFEPVNIPKGDQLCAIPKEVELPPWNGFGTYEDSEINCRSIILKLPHKNYLDFMEKDRQGYNSYRLRFSARLISKLPEDCGRFFIVNYYVADQTISVFEVTCRNSGRCRGFKF